MKKKVILIVSILLLTCIAAMTLSGCFPHLSDGKINLYLPKKDKSKEKLGYDTLELLSAYQLRTGGNVYLNIKDKKGRGIEYTLNDGEDWVELKSDYLWRNYISVDESYYGKTLNIAVRMAEDNKYRESEKSNTISYFVMAPNKVQKKDFIEEPKEGCYQFVLDGGKAVLKRYYEDQDGNLALKIVEESDDIDLQYIIMPNEDIVTEEDIDNFKTTFEELLEIVEVQLEDKNELYDYAKSSCVRSKYLGNKKYDYEWQDYDCVEGIAGEVFADSIVARYDIDGDNICRVGNEFYISVYVRGDDSTMDSEEFVVSCRV